MGGTGLEPVTPSLSRGAHLPQGAPSLPLTETVCGLSAIGVDGAKYAAFRVDSLRFGHNSAVCAHSWMDCRRRALVAVWSHDGPRRRS